MKHCLVLACLTLAGVAVRAQGPAEPLPSPAPRTVVPETVLDPAPVPLGPPMDGFVPAPRHPGPLDVDLQTMRHPFESLVTTVAPVGPAPVPGAIVPLRVPITGDSAVEVGGLVRGFLWNDQRIVWSGLEATFGAESALRVAAATRDGDWVLGTEAEVFLNMRWGTSILSDPVRDMFRTNFDVDQYQLVQLYVEAANGPLSVRLGRSRTPFGRYQSPVFTNTFADAQFIRTDVIGANRLGGFVDTGLFFHYQPGLFVADLAVVNGEPDLDTNSSKAVISRLGLDGGWWTVGTSAKYQDGVGSETLKRYNNVFGVDGSVAVGPFLVYSEAVYDQHGFTRNPANDPNFNPTRLGVRSLYGRDAFSGKEDDPIGGRGCYVGVTYRETKWILDVSVGRYQPDKIGRPDADRGTTRVLVKTAYQLADHLQFYISALVENSRPQIAPLTNQQPYAVFAGIQCGY